VLRDHGGQTVLVVSHVTPIKILLCRALGVPLGTLYRLYLGSACINEIQWHGRGFAAVHCVNDTSHLPLLAGPVSSRRERRSAYAGAGLRAADLTSDQ
jgi:probable phosphoglycerate mutase